ncbi:Phytanoyl-CoA dioxygenase (PhyH) [Filimonas lacunae]|uniref:Phytanoyl-CoA dioxygenase (PhyH) n=1 Tax=Filimonas lacunae TaxID=477680 RepID=A0A173MIK0_9BACT|nr:phytanoyl-CoA dioxygenase family protein [Filimonas lacunae]BAV07287.1 hypothetical protein FLA_3310 [Filimonas lacunae]SIS91959.1 Phytanoyl-CoA dioxygenase (PhyH) [Filimonas lacunae]
MIHCTFLPVFYEYHQCKKTGKPLPEYAHYQDVENVWMSFYDLGAFEAFQFIYTDCTSIAHFQEWLIGRRGLQQVQESAAAFALWMQQKDAAGAAVRIKQGVLSDEQLQCWQEQGYVRVSGLLEEHLCDAVVALICRHMGVDLSNPATWYNGHAEWHGLMLQLYQDEHIYAIKSHPAIKQVFAELYGTDNIIARTEKVSFNPPETEGWKFAHSGLHWDVDLKKEDLYYIQGLVYLNDVPENRGPLKVVPGFQHRFGDWMKTYPDFQEAHQAMIQSETAIPVPGKKGDLVLWQQTLPHAASVNHSHLPRFVQYVSFSKL